jgi:heme-degrading monooxygenase HmoA
MILAKVKVADYETFKSVFTTDGAERRRQAGSKGARAFQNVDDPTEVWVLFDWPTEDYQRFLEDPDSRAIMARAGIQGPPEYTVVEAGPEADA